MVLETQFQLKGKIIIIRDFISLRYRLNETALWLHLRNKESVGKASKTERYISPLALPF